MISFIALRSAVCAAGFLWLWGWIALALRRYDAALGGLLPEWTSLAGTGLLMAGGALAFWCIASFVVRGRGTPALFDPPRKLVAVGPYHYIRNPMYVGGTLLLLGLGCQQRSPAIVAFVPVWWLLTHLLVVLYEEPTLKRKFGADYEEYCRRFPRWLPR